MRSREWRPTGAGNCPSPASWCRSEEHTSELQSLRHLVCRLLLEKKTTTIPSRSEEHTSEIRCHRHRLCRSPPRPVARACPLCPAVAGSTSASFFFFFFLMIRPPPKSPLFPYPTLFRSGRVRRPLAWAANWPSVFPLPQRLLPRPMRSEEHTSELQSLRHLVCRLLLE